MINVQAVGGAKNLRVAFTIKRRDGSGVSFTLTPREATDLADQLNAVLDDPNESETKRSLKGR